VRPLSLQPTVLYCLLLAEEREVIVNLSSAHHTVLLAEEREVTVHAGLHAIKSILSMCTVEHVRNLGVRAQERFT
jgi:hypothetical protein